MSRIMVIDDEKYIREWYSIELSDMGYEIKTVGSCYKILNKIELFQPDLIVLDIRLIECDGLELLQEIRNCYPETSVIICSAYDSYRDDIKTIAADYYVIKSFDLSELKSKIERALETTVPLLTKAV